MVLLTVSILSGVLVPVIPSPQNMFETSGKPENLLICEVEKENQSVEKYEYLNHFKGVLSNTFQYRMYLTGSATRRLPLVDVGVT